MSPDVGTLAHNVYEFFFSSRRRHTRFDCDWSSDVCSSDLRGDPTGKDRSVGEDFVFWRKFGGGGNRRICCLRGTDNIVGRRGGASGVPVLSAGAGWERGGGGEKGNIGGGRVF